MSLTLSDDQIKRLEASLLEIPGKFAIPILQLVNSFIQENTPTVKAKEPDKEETVIPD